MRWWRRIGLVWVAPLVVAGAATLLTVASNVATGGSSPWFPWVERHPLWWTIGAAVTVAAAAVLSGWAQRRADRAFTVMVPAGQRPESWVVHRPAEVDGVVRALLGRPADRAVG